MRDECPEGPPVRPFTLTDKGKHGSVRCPNRSRQGSSFFFCLRCTGTKSVYDVVALNSYPLLCWWPGRSAHGKLSGLSPRQALVRYPFDNFRQFLRSVICIFLSRRPKEDDCLGAPFLNFDPKITSFGDIDHVDCLKQKKRIMVTMGSSEGSDFMKLSASVDKQRCQ